MSKYDAEVEAYGEYRDRKEQNTAELEEQAAMIEHMKAHINEYPDAVSPEGSGRIAGRISVIYRPH